jgi:deazaflavin-dependent oxidoreductase (nitroreductase family)
MSVPRNQIKSYAEENLRRFLESNGERGATYQGAPVLVLTTTGRKSGELRSTPLIYGRDGDNFVLVASVGGHEDNPGWYLNLTATPGVQLQVGADKFDAVARTAAGEERERLWQQMAEVFPSYVEYQANTDREIPVVVLERA